jgi:hypothetical protein
MIGSLGRCGGGAGTPVRRPQSSGGPVPPPPRLHIFPNCDNQVGNAPGFLLHAVSVLRIRDVYPGSEFFPSRIRIEFKYFKPKKLFLNSRKYDPVCASRIRILIFYPSWIPDPGVKKAPDPGSVTLASGPAFCKWLFCEVADSDLYGYVLLSLAEA